MGVQEDHDAADDLLLGPARGDPSGANVADARNFTQTGRECSMTSNTAAPKALTSLPA
jgi:hypothetical protein